VRQALQFVNWVGILSSLEHTYLKPHWEVGKGVVVGSAFQMLAEAVSLDFVHRTLEIGESGLQLGSLKLAVT
jgi:hypothetical protein